VSKADHVCLRGETNSGEINGTDDQEGVCSDASRCSTPVKKVHSFPLTGIVATPQQNKGNSIKGIFSKPKTHEPQKSITPHWIELWEEESLESLGKSKLEVRRTSTQSAKEARQPRKQRSEKKPNTRRVVIYCTDKIITIRCKIRSVSSRRRHSYDNTLISSCSCGRVYTSSKAQRGEGERDLHVDLRARRRG
jgi:hypothetical protein